jgi:hypothetical protein
MDDGSLSCAYGCGVLSALLSYGSRESRRVGNCYQESDDKEERRSGLVDDPFTVQFNEMMGSSSR